MEGYTCYLPSNLNVDILLGECPPRGINMFNKDKLIYTIGLVNQITANNKDLKTPNGFIPINANTLQSHIWNYKQYLDYTINTEVYETDNTFIIGKKSTGYKYSPKYDTTIKPVNIADNTFIKQLNKPTLQDYINQRKYHYVFKWFNPNLQIDKEKAMDCCLEIYNQQREEIGEQKARQNFKRNLINVSRIINHDYILTVDDTVGRFHSNITLLKSELRQFLTYDNHPLVSLDIANAQPYFSTILFNPEFWKPTKESKLPITYYTILNKSTHKFNINLPSLIMLVNRIKEKDYQDVARFRDLVSKGQFYEYLQTKAEERLKTKLSRKYIKKEVLLALNSNNSYNTPLKAIIKELFPNVFELFSLIKEHDKSNLAHILLNLESILILGNIAKTFNHSKPDSPIFSIHDCLTTNNSSIGILYNFTQSVLNSTFQLNANLKFE